MQKKEGGGTKIGGGEEYLLLERKESGCEEDLTTDGQRRQAGFITFCHMLIQLLKFKKKPKGENPIKIVTYKKIINLK